MSAGHVHMMCGAPLPAGGLCATCDTIRDLEAAAACATCTVLATNRLEWLGLKQGEAISASDGEAVALERAVAVACAGTLPPPRSRPRSGVISRSV